MIYSRRAVFPVIGGAGLGLAGCGKSGPFNVDPTTIDFTQLATLAAKACSGLLPTAKTLADILAALFLPAATPVVEAANAVAKAFCDSIAPKVAQRRAAGKFRTAIEPGTGKPIEDYGTIIMPNGKAVHAQVYA